MDALNEKRFVLQIDSLDALRGRLRVCAEEILRLTAEMGMQVSEFLAGLDQGKVPQLSLLPYIESVRQRIENHPVAIDLFRDGFLFLGREDPATVDIAYLEEQVANLREQHSEAKDLIEIKNRVRQLMENVSATSSIICNVSEFPDQDIYERVRKGKIGLLRYTFSNALNSILIEKKRSFLLQLRAFLDTLASKDLFPESDREYLDHVLRSITEGGIINERHIQRLENMGKSLSYALSLRMRTKPNFPSIPLQQKGVRQGGRSAEEMRRIGTRRLFLITLKSLLQERGVRVGAEEIQIDHVRQAFPDMVIPDILLIESILRSDTSVLAEEMRNLLERLRQQPPPKRGIWSRVKGWFGR